MVDSSQNVIRSTRSVTRRNQPESLPTRVPPSSSGTELSSPVVVAPQSGLQELATTASSLVESMGRDPAMDPGGLSPQQLADRAIFWMEHCPIGQLDLVLNVPLVRRKYQVRPILEVSSMGQLAYHLMPSLNQYETRELLESPPQKAGRRTRRRLSTSGADGHAGDGARLSEPRIEDASEDAAGETESDGDTEPDGGEAGDEVDESEGVATPEPGPSETASRDGGRSVTTGSGSRIQTIDGSAEPEVQPVAPTQTDRIDRSLTQAVAMMVAEEGPDGDSGSNWAKTAPDEHRRLTDALSGSPALQQRQVQVFFSISEQIAGPSALEALCQQSIKLSRRESGGDDPLEARANGRLLEVAGSGDATENRVVRTTAADFLERVEGVDLPGLYHKLVSLDRSRWFNMFQTRFYLCMLASALEQVTLSLGNMETGDVGVRGKVRASDAKDRLWERLFPGLERMSAAHVSERRAFDRRIARGRQWNALVKRFGLGLLPLIPLEFPDSWLEKHLQQRTTLELFMDHLERRHPQIHLMTAQGEELMHALMRGTVPDKLPTEPGRMREWLMQGSARSENK